MNGKEIIFAIWTTDDERSGSIKAYCASREIAERELMNYRDWFCSEPPEPDKKHIREIEVLTE